jgi:hypothetical protein
VVNFSAELRFKNGGQGRPATTRPRRPRRETRLEFEAAGEAPGARGDDERAAHADAVFAPGRDPGSRFVEDVLHVELQTQALLEEAELAPKTVAEERIGFTLIGAVEELRVGVDAGGRLALVTVASAAEESGRLAMALRW